MNKEVNYDSLFRAYVTEEIETPLGPMVVMARTLGKTAAQEREREGQNAARAMRKELNDESSDAYRLFVESVIEDMTRNELEEAVVGFRRALFLQEAEKLIQPELEEQADGETIADAIERDVIDEKEWERVEEARKEFVENSLEEYAKEVKKMPLEKLVEIVKRRVIDVQTTISYYNGFDVWTVYRGIYKAKKRGKGWVSDGYLFDEPPFDADPVIFDRLLSLYARLDIASKDPKASSKRRLTAEFK